MIWLAGAVRGCLFSVFTTGCSDASETIFRKFQNSLPALIKSSCFCVVVIVKQALSVTYFADGGWLEVTDRTAGWARQHGLCSGRGEKSVHPRKLLVALLQVYQFYEKNYWLIDFFFFSIQACPTENCNKKLVDQGNGMWRCEKCNREFPNYKWRMILQVSAFPLSSLCIACSCDLVFDKCWLKTGYLIVYFI